MEYGYEIVSVYGNYATKYNAVSGSMDDGHPDIPRTYQMTPVDLRIIDLTRPQIYLGSTYVIDNQIWVWVHFGTDLQGIGNSHPELYPITYKIVVEFTRREIIPQEDEETP